MGGLVKIHEGQDHLIGRAFHEIEGGEGRAHPFFLTTPSPDDDAVFTPGTTKVLLDKPAAAGAGFLSMSRLLSHRHPWLYWLAVRYHRCRRSLAWRLEK